MNWALSRLKAEFREAVLLYYTGRLSYEEIAEVLGLQSIPCCLAYTAAEKSGRKCCARTLQRPSQELFAAPVV
jgi:DNA-directed RNA polymerase specialized sigma24 family protein